VEVQDVDVVDAPQSLKQSALLRELMYELGEHARRGGTAYGAAVVVRRVGAKFGLTAGKYLPLPRPTREERETARAVRDGFDG